MSCWRPTNLEIGITAWVGARVTAEGAISVPAKLLTDVVSGLSNGVVDLSLDVRTQTLHIRCADSAVAILRPIY
jgi:DNA polymerase-3 subunit beta